MCTLVRTRDVTVLLDAGVALGPRFRLMPHPREFKERDHARERINEAAAKAKVVTISHYHNDHHTQTTSTRYGLEALPSCHRKRTPERLSSPRTFEATSTPHSAVGVGCSSRPPKSGLRNSRPQITERSSLERQLLDSLPQYHMARMSRALDGSCLALSKNQAKKLSTHPTFRDQSRKILSKSYLTRSPVW